MNPRRVAILAALLALATRPAPALASCGAESCPLDVTRWNVAGRWSLEVFYQYTEQDQLRSGTRDVTSPIEQLLGSEVLTQSRTTTTTLIMPLPWRARLTASLPFVDRLHEHITFGTLAVPELREWQYHGLGDMTALVDWSLLSASGRAPALNLQTGIKLPTGDTSVPDIDGEELEPHARPGSGSTDFLFGLSAVERMSLPSFGGPGLSTSLFASALYRYTGIGTDGWRLGRSIEGHAGLSYPVLGPLLLIAQLDGSVLDKDQHTGAGVDGGHGHGARASAPRPSLSAPGGGFRLLELSAGGDDEDTGGTYLFASPGLRWEALPGVAVSGYAQIPLIQDVNGTQLVAGTQYVVGVTYRLR